MRSTRSNAMGILGRWMGALCLATLALFAAQGIAQIAGTANVQGTVLDASGAVVQNAAITITDVATQVEHSTRSDRAGVYVFPGLATGTYNLRVVASGFKTYEQTNIVLEVGSSIGINASLQVGAASTEVQVHSEGLALQTEDPSFKQTVDEKDITEMPLNSTSRQITGLLTVSGGSNTAPGNDFTGSKYSYQTISISIAGGKSQAYITRSQRLTNSAAWVRPFLWRHLEIHHSL